jgi:purine-binding chemotaxis protein CheW
MSESALVTFQLQNELFAFDVRDVEEVLATREVTRLPGMAAHVVGVASWRGGTIPVVQLTLLLKPGEAPPDLKRRMLVLRRPGPIGVLIDRPGRVLAPGEWATVSRPTGEDADPSGEGIRLVKTSEGIVRVLDPGLITGVGPNRVDRPGALLPTGEDGV